MEVVNLQISGRIACESYIATFRPRHCQDLQRVHIAAERLMPKLQLLLLTIVSTVDATRSHRKFEVMCSKLCRERAVWPPQYSI